MGGNRQMGPKTMATCSKVACFSHAKPAGGITGSGLPGKGALLAATAVGLVCLGGMTKPAEAFGLFGDSYYAPQYQYGNSAMMLASRHARRGGSSGGGSSVTGGGNSAKDAAKKETPKPPAGPLIIVVSIGSEHVTVYDDGTPIMSGPTSTGVQGHPTPMGIFSVIQKDRFHHSNIYSGAPMPYMQRITWSGVALHEGVVTGHPASHGCIRLPHDMAARLWTMTKMGVRVVVTPQNQMSPSAFEHPSLVALATKPAAPDVATPSAPTPPAATQKSALNLPAYSSLAPASLASQKVDVPAAPLGEGIETVAFDQRPADANPGLVTQADPPTFAPLPSAVPTSPPAVERQYKPGPVSVFVSRKLGKLYVRKGNEPIFDMPITISHPEQPIGTYLFTAGQPTEDGSKLRWLAMQVASGKSTVEPPKKMAGKHGRQEAAPAPAPAQVVSQVSPAEALDRIQIPQEALDRISPLVTPGASLIVSDLGISGETGKDTDFIILAH
jgi:lipoprotein-anchoring transpeptidase ErfK/SrfK